MGAVGDRIGRRKLLMIGAAAFAAASVLAAFSTSPVMLIGSRALLGVAGATLAPSTLALISNMFHDPVERTKAIGIWIASFSVGAAVGALLGGRARRRTVETRDELTPQEQQIARLARDGLSNPEIGARLFLSPVPSSGT